MHRKSPNVFVKIPFYYTTLGININMSYKTFTEWLIQEKKDIFGFKKPEIDRHRENDYPIKGLDYDCIFKELMHHSVGLKTPFSNFHDQITWGDKSQGEAIRLEMTPLGSARMVTRRFIKDLEGNELWICKNVKPLPDWSYQENELQLVDELCSKIEEIDKTEIDSARQECDLEYLAMKLGSEIKMQKPCKWMVFDKIKKLTEHHYIITMNMTGYGGDMNSGSGLSMKTEQFHIQLHFDKPRGIIRCFGHGIESPKKFSSWKPTISDWDENFTPTQTKSEIIESIIKSLESY